MKFYKLYFFFKIDYWMKLKCCKIFQSKGNTIMWIIWDDKSIFEIKFYIIMGSIIDENLTMFREIVTEFKGNFKILCVDVFLSFLYAARILCHPC